MKDLGEQNQKAGKEKTELNGKKCCLCLKTSPLVWLWSMGNCKSSYHAILQTSKEQGHAARVLSWTDGAKTLDLPSTSSGDLDVSSELLRPPFLYL